MNKKKAIIWLSSICVLALGIANLFRFNHDELEFPRPKIYADAKMSGIFYQKIKKNQLIMKLRADEAILLKKDKRLTARHLTLSVLKDGTQLAKLRSLKGELDLDTMDALFLDDVRLETKNNGVLFTQKLRYIPSSELLTTDVPVIIQKGGLKVTGKALSYNLKTGKMLIKESKTFIESQ
ncbi:hypothetical protein DBT_2089 [Dissulfuribacter thermophilus]|uniref:LPS export ABC transporter periplasmic protein LptC n=1 Tax=Dissulfuribacter thermophilus TaxID=1156395 RepID=A0A1B9F3N4_9BACT|nr:LPS export ABC transporter periplasmic protein LptC [Dissulfuribacter thermophilus]OCC14547.1 hypothetical protein DBT_2089 [Dissulfuribacter thermophilus]